MRPTVLSNECALSYARWERFRLVDNRSCGRSSTNDGLDAGIRTNSQPRIGVLLSSGAALGSIPKRLTIREGRHVFLS
jgi:hypothetical protein